MGNCKKPDREATKMLLANCITDELLIRARKLGQKLFSTLTTMEIIKNDKGGLKLLHEGYMYTKKYAKKTVR